MAESSLLYSGLTRNIIGAAMEVHKVLGAGFVESVYEESLAIEFDLRKIPYERQKPIDILYKGRIAKHFVCDFLVYDKIIVELKAIKTLSDIELAQVLSYLKGTGRVHVIFVGRNGRPFVIARPAEQAVAIYYADRC